MFWYCDLVFFISNITSSENFLGLGRPLFRKKGQNLRPSGWMWPSNTPLLALRTLPKLHPSSFLDCILLGCFCRSCLYILIMLPCFRQTIHPVFCMPTMHPTISVPTDPPASREVLSAQEHTVALHQPSKELFTSSSDGPSPPPRPSFSLRAGELTVMWVGHTYTIPEGLKPPASLLPLAFSGLLFWLQGEHCKGARSSLHIGQNHDFYPKGR